MNIEIPSHINPNDLIAALNAGVEAINRSGQQSVDPMATYNTQTLRDFREVVVRAARG